MTKDEMARSIAVRGLDRSIAVDAGAGTGKTSVLVERVLGLVERGVAPERVAAITFTEAAAGELRHRLFDLHARRLGEDATAGRYLPALDDARRAHLRASADRLQRMTVTTLHAFALGLLEAEALSARWAPGTAVEDALGAGEAMRGVWEGSAEAWAEEAWWGALRARVGAKDLDTSLRRVRQFRDLEISCAVSSADPRLLQEALTESINAAGRCSNPACKLSSKAKLTLELAERVLAAPASSAALLARYEAPRLGNAGAAKDWGGGAHKEAFRHAADEVARQLKALRDAEPQAALRAWLTRAREELLPQLRSQQRTAGRAGFDDLLFDARDLLRDHPMARARLSERFSHLLVDEVQDTDPLQSEIVRLLGGEGPLDGSGPRLRPGSVFAVGDPKQSIYRFRRADPRSWRELSDAVVRDGEALNLVQNFRSVPAIVDYVNVAFASLEGYTRLEGHRDAGSIDPVVVLRATEEEEADAVVSHLRGLFEDGSTIVDPSSGSPRTVEPRDVMVLVPSWSKADQIADRLARARIDAFVDGGKTFFLRDEVRLALAALRALVDAGDGEAVVSVLRGLFGCSFTELAEHKAEDRGWRYTTPDAEASGRVGQALRAVRDARPRSGEGLVVALDRVLESSAAPAVWQLMPRSVGIAANLDKVRELIRRFETEGLAGANVVERIERLRDQGDPESDLPLRPFEASAVEVTTLFKAKGRERPIVVLYGMHRASDPVDVVVDRDRGSVTSKVGSLKPADWETQEAREKSAA